MNSSSWNVQRARPDWTHTTVSIVQFTTVQGSSHMPYEEYANSTLETIFRLPRDTKGMGITMASQWQRKRLHAVVSCTFDNGIGSDRTKDPQQTRCIRLPNVKHY